MLHLVLQSGDHKPYGGGQAQLVQADFLVAQVLFCCGELPADELLYGASTAADVIFSQALDHDVRKM